MLLPTVTHTQKSELCFNYIIVCYMKINIKIDNKIQLLSKSCPSNRPVHV